MEHRKWKTSEFETATSRPYENPFWDVQVKAEFRHEDGGAPQTVSAFYDGRDNAGQNRWKIRWTPNREGNWLCQVASFPANDELAKEFRFAANGPEPGTRGFLRTDPSASYGFRFDNGEPFFLFGDTLYNLFGAAYCGVDIESVLRKRRSQGINYIRSRMQVSSYLPGITNQWQNRDCWPWGGNAQLPDFMSLNLAYFEAVDRVVALASELGMGFELILQGWMMEYPFNDRGKFIAEFEEFWHEYIVARYTAYDSVYIWCPANEYEYYPLGLPVRYNKESNRWLMRLSRQIRSFDPHAHPIGAHNWEKKIPLYERLGHCETIDVFLVQTDWAVPVLEGQADPSLCLEMERDLRRHSGGGAKVSICAEFGYERTEGLMTDPVHQYMDSRHTRRGQWRAGFSGYPIVHGFDNTWGPHLRLDKEPPGTGYLFPYYTFMTETVRFDRLIPSSENLIWASGKEEDGTLPLCVTDRSSGVTAVYFPTGGSCELAAEAADEATYRWIDPRTGEASEPARCIGARFATPNPPDGEDADADWVLLVVADSL